VTDYLPEERARGITITAAAITFSWSDYNINLIDTPGHADFTFEVSRSLRVLDGAVAILDGVAGVESQTETVWRQANEWGISRIAFVNKMDREGAGFGRTVREIALKLGVRPLVMQLPIFEEGLEGGSFKGVLDLVDLTVFTWPVLSNAEAQVSITPLAECSSKTIVDEARVARAAMLEVLAELDDTFLELYLEHQDITQISHGHIREAIRSLTTSGAIVPVFCGASLRDIGVQPILDAIINYLPSPLERPMPVIRFEDEDREVMLPRGSRGVCALAFKVIHDAKKGPLVFVRVYQGSIAKGMTLQNTRTRERERANRLLRMYADDSVEIDTITEGNIGVVLGLKSTVTGDTIVGRSSDSNFYLQPITTPPPVFIASIEPDSLGEAQAVSDALRRLLREDPSLSVTTDSDSGQILLGGMGELHLEISRDRLIKDFGAKCEMGKVRVSYREAIPGGSASLVEKIYDREINGKLTKVGLRVQVSSLDGSEPSGEPRRHRRQFQEFGNLIDIDLSGAHGLPGIDEGLIFEAICTGIRPTLQSGSAFQLPLHSTLVQVTNLLVFENQTTYQSIVSAARIATQEALKVVFLVQNGILMEPFMKVHVTVDGKDVGRVVSNLTSARGSAILSIDSCYSRNSNLLPRVLSIYSPPDSTYHEEAVDLDCTLKTVVACVPLKEMAGYSKTLRSLTQGRGTFVMSLEGFKKMTGERASSVRKEILGVAL
jgi:elongation factor G